MNKSFYLFLVCFCLLNSIFAQKKYGKPIEVSLYPSFGIGFSKLSNQSDNRFSSPAQGSALSNIGFKIERQFFKEKRLLFINTGVFSIDLPVTAKFDFKETERRSSNTYTIYPVYDVWQNGLKKILKVNKNKSLSYSIEGGLRLLIGRNGNEDSMKARSNFLDSTITWHFNFEKRKKFTLVPYIACGVDYQYKKMKFGIQFWAQNGFRTIETYDYQVKYGRYQFNSKAITRGLVMGANVFIKVISF